MTEMTQAQGAPSGAAQADRGVATGGTVANASVTSVDGSQKQQIDWSQVDWSAVPWEQVNVPIDMIPQVKKMQGSLNKKQTQAEKAAAQERSRREALEQQLEAFRQIAAGTAPELNDQFQQATLAQRTQMLEKELGSIQQVEQKQEALAAMAEHFELDPELFAGAESIYDAVDIMGGYWKLQTTQLQEQLADMQRKLAAAIDPVSTPDRGASAGANDYQTQYDELMKSYHGDKAAKVRKEAEAKGLTIDLTSWRK